MADKVTGASLVTSHTCTLRTRQKRGKTCLEDRGQGSKKYQALMQKVNGKWLAIQLRYPKINWTSKQAQKECMGRGPFRQAKKTKAKCSKKIKKTTSKKPAEKKTAAKKPAAKKVTVEKPEGKVKATARKAKKPSVIKGSARQVKLEAERVKAKAKAKRKGENPGHNPGSHNPTKRANSAAGFVVTAALLVIALTAMGGSRGT